MRKLPEAMVSSLGSPRNHGPGLKYKECRDGSCAFSLGDAWMILLQLPAFPKGWHFGWVLDGRRNSGHSLDWASLAEGGRVILWVF